MLKCPVCKSARIKKGYRPTPFWSKMLLRFNLLCENCNWEFADFALPWKIPAKSTRSVKKRRPDGENSAGNDLPNNFDKAPVNIIQLPDDKAIKEDRKEVKNRKVKNRVRAKA